MLIQLKGRIKDGKLVVDLPPELPDMEVLITGWTDTEKTSADSISYQPKSDAGSIALGYPSEWAHRDIHLKGMITTDGKLEVQLLAGLTTGEVEITLTRPLESFYDEKTIVVDLGYRTANAYTTARPRSRGTGGGGDHWCNQLYLHMREKHHLLIGLPTAEKALHNLESVFPSHTSREITIKGRNLLTGKPDSVSIKQSEIREIIRPYIESIAFQIKNWIDYGIWNPETKQYERLNFDRIILKGECIWLKDFDKLLEMLTDLPVIKG